ncbi:hypothetical protein [Lysobacter sp. CFH 32150]|uniref:hypothetical protein n=1 Tax=Lysobacter sp. CFH 32150 TaxID=2927128 RepID=UPI001FA75ED4|nr:hypothetical protein [Lysobacter sp. CFH 32150]MCI4569030.1 hypothetical protein [Lysobacter sp. CFH 32150]
MLTMKNALKKLIDDLDAVAVEHEEVSDTDVREQMYDAVHKSFIAPRPGFSLPESFGMFSDEGDRKVLIAIREFLAAPGLAAAAAALKTPEARLDAFQDIDVQSDAGNAYDWYFGYSDAP